MFTGLIQAVGTVVRTETHATGARFTIDPHNWDHRATLGDSISINGCCLTVSSAPALASGQLSFDIVHETLRMTTLGSLAAGARVNLEPAARADTLLGGHLVQGHIDGIAEVEHIDTTPEHRLRLRPPPVLMEFIIPKGSIAIDGVSLTLAAVDPTAGAFEVALIPTTLAKTTLADLRAGSRCNLETDAMARTVVHWLRHYANR